MLLGLATPFINTLTFPDAPSANLREPQFQSGLVTWYGTASKKERACPPGVIVMVLPPLAVANAVAASFAASRPDQNTAWSDSVAKALEAALLAVALPKVKNG